MFGKKNDYEVNAEWKKKYGDVFTTWMGEQAVVNIADFDLAKDAFLTRGTDFAGRMNMVGT